MGVGVFLLLQPFTHPFRSSPSATYCPRLPFSLSLFTTVSHGTELGFPLRLCSSAQPVCCLSHCKCVSGSPSNFCTSRQSPPLFAIHSAAHLIKRPALFSGGLLFHERNGRSSLPICGGRHSRPLHVPLYRHCVTVYTTGATCDRLHGRCESGGMLDLIFPWVNSTNASPEATWNSSVPP